MTKNQELNIWYKNQWRSGFVVETKMDKVKVAIFDTADWGCPMNGIKWGHFIAYDWYEANSDYLHKV